MTLIPPRGSGVFDPPGASNKVRVQWFFTKSVLLCRHDCAREQALCGGVLSHRRFVSICPCKCIRKAGHTWLGDWDKF
jgi:hypothetical protein